MSYTAYDMEPRCHECGKLLAIKVTRPWIIGCVRCKARNSSDDRTLPSRIVLEEDRT